MRSRSPSSESSLASAPARARGVWGGNKETLLAAPHDAPVAVDVRGHDRLAGGHRLQEHDAERLTAGGRGDEHVGGGEEARLLRVGDAAEELDPAGAPGEQVPPNLLLEGTGAGQEEATLAARLAQEAIGLQQVHHALSVLEPTDEEDVPDAVAPPLDRLRRPEARDVDPIGDDLVVTREVPVGEVAGGRAPPPAPPPAAGGG